MYPVRSIHSKLSLGDAVAGVLGKDERLCYGLEIGNPDDTLTCNTLIDLIQRPHRLFVGISIAMSGVIGPIKMRIHSKRLADGVTHKSGTQQGYARMLQPLRDSGVRVLVFEKWS